MLSGWYPGQPKSSNPCHPSLLWKREGSFSHLPGQSSELSHLSSPQLGVGERRVRLLPACPSGGSPNVRLLWSERMVKSAEAAVRLHCRARRVESSVGILMFLGCRLSSFMEPDWGVRYTLGSLGALAVPDPWALTILDTSKEIEYPKKKARAIGNNSSFFSTLITQLSPIYGTAITHLGKVVVVWLKYPQHSFLGCGSLLPPTLHIHPRPPVLPQRCYFLNRSNIFLTYNLI